MKKTIYTFSIMVFLSSFALSQVHRWERTNPGGGGAFSTIGAGITGIVVAGSDLSGAYISRDRGNSWEVLGYSKGLTATHVSGVGFDRLDGDLLYIGTDEGIFRSTDGGRSVKQVLEGGYITDIEFGTAQPNIGYATYHPMYNTTQGAIFRTTDRGLNWSKVSLDLPDDLRILKLIVHPAQANTLYLLSGEGRFACGPAQVWKSKDGGKHWVQLASELSPILDIAMRQKAPYALYLTTMHAACGEQWYWTDVEGDLYKSTDGGQHWAWSSDYTGVIWLDDEDSSVLRLIDPREPYTWNDRSGTFTSVNDGFDFGRSGDVEDWDTFFQGNTFWCYGSSYNGICKALGEDLSDPDSYWWVNPQWVFHTSDAGKTFHNSFTDEVKPGFWRSRGFDNVNMMAIEVSPVDDDIVYIGYFDMGIWRSLDHGESWQSCNDSIFTGSWDGYGGNCATIVADPSRANVVWASLGENQEGQPLTFLLKSDKKGAKGSWQRADNGLPNEEIMGLSIDTKSPQDQRTLYVTALSDVYRSTDDGRHWSKVLDGKGCRFTAVDQVDTRLVYAGGERGIWRSEDRGNTWTDISLDIMQSTDNTGFWEWGYDGVWDIETDPAHEGWVYVVVHGTDKGLYRSKDKGQTWEHLLTDDFLRNVGILPTDNNIVYATSSSAFEAGGWKPGSNGIWYSEDGGNHWSRQNQGMAWPFAQPVAFDRRTPTTVFVGSPGTGIQKALVPFSTSNQTIRTTSSDLTIYPNPAKDFIRISCRYEMVKLRLIAADGRTAKTFQPKGHIVQHKISGLPTGIYFLQIKIKTPTGEKWIYRRIVIDPAH